MKKKIGVYVCHCGSNIAGFMDVAKLTEFAGKLDNVAVARHYPFMCSDPGQDMIKNDIKEMGLDGVLVCSCSPNMHLRTFRAACQDAGLNPFQCEMATIRELSAWVHSHDQKAATETAMGLVADGVRRVAYRVPLRIDYAPVNPITLIVGGGIAGIQTALEIARSEHKVYIIEKEPSIGGHMAQLNVTFPRLESAVDMLSARMKMVEESEYIELLTYCEVTEVSGYIGNFEVTVKKKARSVDPAKCDGCRACIEKCPVETDNEFDMGLSKRKAIYMQFPEAVPNIPVIDREHCTRYTGGECSLCKEACPKDAIDYEAKDETMVIECGNIIVATGYDVFNPAEMTRYGYKKYDNVITSMEFERLASPTGPTGGNIVLKDGSAPKSVAIVHCVGSRDRNYHEYCSRICCTYGLKDANLIREKTGAEVYQMYMTCAASARGTRNFTSGLPTGSSLHPRQGSAGHRCYPARRGKGQADSGLRGYPAR
jgi:heterodisulfide reductase subunit A